jgi:hypothetical protein
LSKISLWWFYIFFFKVSTVFLLVTDLCRRIWLVTFNRVSLSNHIFSSTKLEFETLHCISEMIPVPLTPRIIVQNKHTIIFYNFFCDNVIRVKYPPTLTTYLPKNLIGHLFLIESPFSPTFFSSIRLEFETLYKYFSPFLVFFVF